jgi:hypothetical protein
VTKGLAQAIRDLATLGRLSEDSEEAISTILDPPEKDEDEDKKDDSNAPTKSTRR